MQGSTFYIYILSSFALQHGVFNTATTESNIMDCPVECLCDYDPIRGGNMTCYGAFVNEFPDSATGHLITFLDLSFNDITIISSPAFDSFPSLETIVMGMSFIRTFDVDTFRKLENLTNLDLHDNTVSFFDPLSFTGNKKLVSLILSGNPIRISEDKPFLVSPSLKSLDLSFCQLTNLAPDVFSMVPNLEVLDLSSNSLKSLSVNTLKSMTKLSQVNLGNNIWSCDCGTNDVLQLSDAYQNSASRRTPFKCFDSFGNEREISQVDNNIPCEEVLQNTLYNGTDDEVYIQTLPDTNETILEKYEEDIILNEDSIIVRIINKVYQFDDESNPTPNKKSENLPNDSFIIYENQQIIAFSYDEEDFEIPDDEDTNVEPEPEKNLRMSLFGIKSLHDYLKWNVLILPLISFIISFLVVVAIAMYKYRCKSSSNSKNYDKIASGTKRNIASFFTGRNAKLEKVDDDKHILIQNV